MKRYQNQLFYYIWKPHGIPTTYGQNICFLDMIKSSKEIQTQLIYTQLQNNHNHDKEFGLINRLDNNTWWLLFFAKNKNIYDEYRSLQSQWNVNKHYICDVHGILENQHITITDPIYHHKHNEDRMTLDVSKSRAQPIYTTTHVEKLYTDEYNKTATLLVKIHKWARHQIRIHLASIWHPIIGEDIYTQSKSHDQNTILHLWSIGLEVQTNIIN